MNQPNPLVASLDGQDDPTQPRKQREHKAYLRYLGALSQVIGIRNKAGKIVGYREGFTKSKLEVMARKLAKKALRDTRMSGMTRALREELSADPQLAKAITAGMAVVGEKQ